MSNRRFLVIHMHSLAQNPWWQMALTWDKLLKVLLESLNTVKIHPQLHHHSKVRPSLTEGTGRIYYLSKANVIKLDILSVNFPSHISHHSI